MPGLRTECWLFPVNIRVPAQGSQAHPPGSTVAAAPEAFPSAVAQALSSALGPAPPSPGCLGSRTRRQERGRVSTHPSACFSESLQPLWDPPLGVLHTSVELHPVPAHPAGVRPICLWCQCHLEAKLLRKGPVAILFRAVLPSRTQGREWTD